ncbi:MAG TPA: winged helix-turn-helix domain-containing protein, partial [Chloroflexota bacterium]|nr:winged helix-turn-helix domain-containing protein [Chloroflexota bacterium]
VLGRRVVTNGETVALQPKEFELLKHLMMHRGTVLTRPRLLNSVWGHEYVGERTVDVHVRRVRAKLEAAGTFGLIRTVHGVGYVFEPEDHLEGVARGA